MPKLAMIACVCCLPLLPAGWAALALAWALEPPPARERPTSQPGDLPPTTDEQRGDRQGGVKRADDDLSPFEEPADDDRVADRWGEAERRSLEFRIRTLEQTVEELTRHVGGPQRDLTLRPEASLDSTLDRFERDLRRLEQQVDRLETRLDAMQRDLERISRRLRV
jgi:chromosome segregation ATPase